MKREAGILAATSHQSREGSTSCQRKDPNQAGKLTSHMGKDKRGNGTSFSNKVKRKYSPLLGLVKGAPECVLRNLFGRKPYDWDRKALILLIPVLSLAGWIIFCLS